MKIGLKKIHYLVSSSLWSLPALNSQPNEQECFTDP